MPRSVSLSGPKFQSDPCRSLEAFRIHWGKYFNVEKYTKITCILTFWRIIVTACFLNSTDSSIFQRIFCFAHCTDEDQKSESIVCIWIMKTLINWLEKSYKSTVLKCDVKIPRGKNRQFTITHTENLSEILLDETEIRLYLPFFDWSKSIRKW